MEFFGKFCYCTVLISLFIQKCETAYLVNMLDFENSLLSYGTLSPRPVAHFDSPSLCYRVWEKVGKLKEKRGCTPGRSGCIIPL